MEEYIYQIKTLFKTLVLNSTGIKGRFLQYIEAGDIPSAIGMMKSREEEVDQALREYNPETHKVMSRPDKPRKGERPYRTEKLPRTRQRYINEVELFFLFGQDIIWTQKGGTPEAYNAFTSFIEDTYFNARTRTAKRIAGAETECAKLYNVYRDGKNEINVNSVILARSTGYQLRSLFDQYGNLVAFAYGYRQKEGDNIVQHWDIQVAEMIIYSHQNITDQWDVETLPNPTGKINVVYIRQPKAWDGAQSRIEREEMLDSKIADTNNYFADPIATATADVIDSIVDPDKPGKLIQLSGPNSSFSYVTPPQQSEIRRAEKEELAQSILFDTFTPDFSFENIRGMGTLSGSAIRNSFILGYMKRARNIEVWSEMIGREKNLILAILGIQRPDIDWKDFDVSFTFAEPFNEDKQQRWSAIAQLYSAGLLSLDTAVDKIDLVDDKDAEIDRIIMAQAQAQTTQEAEAEQQQQPTAEEPTAEDDGNEQQPEDV